MRCERLSADDHRDRERAWRTIYGHVFEQGLRHRHGVKAVHEYLTASAEPWMLVPFLGKVRGTPVDARDLRLSAFACEGPLLELGDFHDAEFFVSPPDFAWTFVRTHEDFEMSGPYFVRAEWIP